MNKCSNCGGPLLDLFTGKACGWECDLPPHKQSPAALGRTKAAMEKVAVYQAQYQQVPVPRAPLPPRYNVGSIQPHPPYPVPVPAPKRRDPRWPVGFTPACDGWVGNHPSTLPKGVGKPLAPGQVPQVGDRYLDRAYAGMRSQVLQVNLQLKEVLVVMEWDGSVFWEPWTQLLCP